jgi:hypothetical protein
VFAAAVGGAAAIEGKLLRQGEKQFRVPSKRHGKPPDPLGNIILAQKF